MIAQLYPISARFQRILRAPPSMDEEAQETEEVWPAETIELPPVLMLDEDRRKVSATHPSTTMDAEWRRVAGGKVACHAINRHVFRNVLATPKGFFTWRAGFSQTARVDRRALLRSRIRTLDKGYYALPRTGMIYFGHWFREGLAGTLLARPGEKIYLPVYPEWPHAQQYVTALSIHRVPADYAFFRQLSFCDDRWVSRSRHLRVATLHERLQQRMPDSGAAGLYLSRGETGERRSLVNEDELVRALLARGFAIAVVTDSLEEIWRKAGRVSTTVSVEGSHWVNALLAARKGSVHVSLCPADRFNNVYAEFMPAIQGRMATAIASREGDRYRIDVAGVMKLLDTLKGAAAA